jgi:hypothetical protein
VKATKYKIPSLNYQIPANPVEIGIPTGAIFSIDPLEWHSSGTEGIGEND